VSPEAVGKKGRLKSIQNLVVLGIEEAVKLAAVGTGGEYTGLPLAVVEYNVITE